MFRVAAGASPEVVLEDFERLLNREGGQGKFGYVLRDQVTGESLAYERHDPSSLGRMRDLSSFGSTSTLGELFEVRRSGPIGLKTRGSEDDVGGLRVITGRDIGRNGSIVEGTSQLAATDAFRGIELRPGDFVLSSIQSPSDKRGLRIARGVSPEDLPAIAAGTVFVLRPVLAMTPGETKFFELYMKSPLARQLLSVAGAAGHTLTRDHLRNLAVPRADGALSAALDELNEGAARVAQWQEEAEEVLAALFENPSATAARTSLLERGRQFRLRVDAAQLLDDFSYTIRTRFPYPVAYRWRSLEALRSGQDPERTYRAVLDTYEVLLCYLAQLALVLGRSAGLEIGAVGAIRDKLRSGRSGPGLGDWTAVLEEVGQGRSFRRLPGDFPLGEVTTFLTTDADTTSARQRLSQRRNDQAHLRSIPSTQVERATDEALADLKFLLERAMFLADLPLIHLASTSWDSFGGTATVHLRYLIGDHPVVPFRHERLERSDLEPGSLYVRDTEGGLHLVRPFLVGGECPECQTWSTFHVDRSHDGTLTLKSLEHGHALIEHQQADALEHVGLL
jgi:hypothetical protein